MQEIIQNERTFLIEDGLVFKASGFPLRCTNCCKQLKFNNNKIEICECRKITEETVVCQTLREEANEIRSNLKEIESVLSRENKTYKRVERRLNKVIKQASRIGASV